MNGDDIPFADPRIRADFEASLGRFILAFNELEYYLTGILHQELVDRQLGHMRDQMLNKSFAAKAELLQVMAAAGDTALRSLPFSEIEILRGHRNKLAHGHFDQNPFDGSYKVIEKERDRDYPATTIDALTDKIGVASEAARQVYYAAAFEVLE